MDKRIIVLFLFISLTLPLFSGCIVEEKNVNEKPTVEITYPIDGATVSSLVTISGTASDLDGDHTIHQVEIMINDDEWNTAEGTTKWSYDWSIYDIDDGLYTIHVRSWDGIDHSELKEITVKVDNPEVVDSNSHKWALFVAAANFAEDNESKLGNGGLNLAEDIATYLIGECEYSTSNIIILFDDGWIRKDNGYGERIKTLQQRKHDYDITYGGATKQNVIAAINHIVSESNKYPDSEVFVWMFGHGCGDEENNLTGGKILENSEIFLWDSTITDNELGILLSDLKSEKKKTCIIIDACFSGGFADKTIYNFPTFFLLRSGLPKSGRIIITGSSKFRIGYASTIQGPLFSFLWFEGIRTGNADGFRSGILDMGRQTKSRLFKDGKVSVEEAFYYARHVLRTDETYEEYEKMEPQINDQYPGTFINGAGMVLG
ncbi:MAG: caspase family protein [Thermoplasmatales archaeon]|nr:MAG: caspase family protein [Thermoplasmatales archaeon]